MTTAPHRVTPVPSGVTQPSGSVSWRSGEVVVEAHARIHFGMLDLAGTYGRRFGGIGAGLSTPSLLLSAHAAPAFGVTVAPDAETWSRSSTASDATVAAIATAAKRVCGYYGIADRAHFTIHRAIPAHHGLGSGTQTALAVARALAELFALPRDPVTLAQVVGRGHRSAIGTYVFAVGGFILEGGRRPDVDRIAPLLVRLPMPQDWRCVLALPPGRPGVSGAAEAAAFAILPPPPPSDAEHMAHLVLMALLPALVEEDFAAFADAVHEIQEINGRWFAPAQGGLYAPGLSATIVDALVSWGASGVGQSSWGPAVYALAPGRDASTTLVSRLRATFPSTMVLDAGFV